jgi:hypothetical protein
MEPPPNQGLRSHSVGNYLTKHDSTGYITAEKAPRPSSKMRSLVALTSLSIIALWLQNSWAGPVLHLSPERRNDAPPPPEPEPLETTRLPMPPVVATSKAGSCTPEINPRRTGCIMPDVELQAGGFLPDGNHVLATIRFDGAPPSPDPRSIYSGQHIILIKADGMVFPNGDPWKCVTCGMPEANGAGRSTSQDYPQAFRDGKRLLIGDNILECDFELASSECTPDQVRIYRIRWNVTPDGSGAGGSIRELRLHPDNVHLGFNAALVSGGKFNQFAYMGRLEFNPSPKTGEPLAPRYDLSNVYMMFDPTAKPPVEVDSARPDHLKLNPDAITVGELRGFSGTGREVTYIGSPIESCNIDVFAADLTTGQVRRLTSHPEYADPVDISPDDKWTVAMDTRGSDRQMFLAGMRGIPPLTDMVSTSISSSTRNNGMRRFFQPYLIDEFGDRGGYSGQKLNAKGNGVPGAGDINDPEWNGRADPKWSPDGTRIVYWQAMTVSPACGGSNPLPCFPSTEEGGRTVRIMLAHLTSRTPIASKQIDPIPDEIPWGIPYVPGSPAPERPLPPAGTYTLEGKVSGSAQVILTGKGDGLSIGVVEVMYDNYSDDGINTLNGRESVDVSNPTPTLNIAQWVSDLTMSGKTNATKKTSPAGFQLSIDILTNIFEANGTLTTTIDGRESRQPENGT